MTPVGAEIDDIMCIEDDDMIFFSAGDPFRAPDLNPPGTATAERLDGESNENEYRGVVGGYKIGAFLGKGGFGEVQYGKWYSTIITNSSQVRIGTHQLTEEQVALKFIMVLCFDLNRTYKVSRDLESWNGIARWCWTHYDWNPVSYGARHYASDDEGTSVS